MAPRAWIGKFLTAGPKCQLASAEDSSLCLLRDHAELRGGIGLWFWGHPADRAMQCQHLSLALWEEKEIEAAAAGAPVIKSNAVSRDFFLLLE